MRSIGILPAAGIGERWGRYPKFLLPCGNKEWLLDRAVRQFPCDEVIVVYGDETCHEIVNHLARQGLTDKVIYTVNERMDLDFWGSILSALEFEVDYYYFAMPDTFLPPRPFNGMIECDFSLGVHWTDTPERFGVIRDGQIVNKQPGAPGWAWGTLGWSKRIRDLWLETPTIQTYTEAINLAMQTIPEYKQVELKYYYDLASWKDYVDFVKSLP